MSIIIDRTGNTSGKSLPNRQRFMDKQSDAIKKAVKDSIARGKIGEIGKDGVQIRGKGLFEPHIHHKPGTGDNTKVVPGNKTYIKGDTVDRPRGGEGSGQGPGHGGTDGEGDDDFEFTISKSEFYDLLFSELELPDMTKEMLQEAVVFRNHRAGFSIQGNPSALNIKRTMRNAMGRRIALNRPSKEELLDAANALALAKVGKEGTDVIEQAQTHYDILQRRSRGIPYVDPIDLRYNRFEKKPDPNTSAVVFFLMDVSASMDEQRKDIAKRFFLLLHIFLEKQYDTVKMVFIRHTQDAKQVDQEEFFHSRETGGTVVSTALQKMIEVQKAEYPLDLYNIYVAQASDGDTAYGDDTECLRLLSEEILPIVQYYCYLETKPSSWDGGETGLWECYDKVPEQRKFQKRKANDVKEIYAVLADLFKKRD